MGMEVGTVAVGGRTIAYRRAGSGPPLVLLHGGWSDSRTWRPQLEGLADAFTVIAWDAPGCGGSQDPPADFRMADYADAVAGLVRALGVRRAHVCGLSFGGGLAMVVYQRHPDLVRSMVLAGAYAGWAGSLPPEVVAERIERVRAELERPPEEWVASYLPGFFSKPMPQEVVDEVTAIMCDSRPEGTMPMLEAFARADLRHSLGDVRVPTLLLWGELDERASLSIGQDLHERIPRSELVVLPAVGHVANLEAPEAFNAEVRRFLQTLGN